MEFSVFINGTMSNGWIFYNSGPDAGSCLENLASRSGNYYNTNQINYLNN